MNGTSTVITPSVSRPGLALVGWVARPNENNETSLDQESVIDAAPEDQTLEEKLSQTRRDVQCVRRAVWLMGFLTAFAVAGLGHATLFLPFFPQTLSQYFMQTQIQVFCTLGLASLGCVIAFKGLELFYRLELGRCEEDYRQIAEGIIDLGVVR